MAVRFLVLPFGVSAGGAPLRSLPPSDLPACVGQGLRDFDIRYNDLKEPAKSRYEEGIPKFLEFLREEEERLKQEEIERMKPVGASARPQHPPLQ